MICMVVLSLNFVTLYLILIVPSILFYITFREIVHLTIKYKKYMRNSCTALWQYSLFCRCWMQYRNHYMSRNVSLKDKTSVFLTPEAHLNNYHIGSPKILQMAITCVYFFEVLGAVSIRKTVLPGMAIPMLKMRRPNGRLIFNIEIAIHR